MMQAGSPKMVSLWSNTLLNAVVDDRTDPERPSQPNPMGGAPDWSGSSN